MKCFWCWWRGCLLAFNVFSTVRLRRLRRGSRQRLLVRLIAISLLWIRWWGNRADWNWSVSSRVLLSSVSHWRSRLPSLALFPSFSFLSVTVKPNFFSKSTAHKQRVELKAEEHNDEKQLNQNEAVEGMFPSSGFDAPSSDVNHEEHKVYNMNPGSNNPERACN